MNWRTLAKPLANATSVIGMRGLRQQPPRGLQPRRPGQGLRPGAQLGHEQPVQVPLGDREPRGQPADPVGVHVAVRDQAHRAGGQVGPDVPVRRARGWSRGGTRRQARNPAASAAPACTKNRMFARAGVRAGQTGRQ